MVGLPCILLIEDDELLRELYAVSLEMEGFKYATASEGREGLALVPVSQPDIILLDMMMPVMGGLEFLKEFAGTESKAHVIVVSNLNTPDNAAAALKAGAKRYLKKSAYTPTELLDYVKEYWQELPEL